MGQENKAGLAQWIRKNWILAAVFVVVLVGGLAYLGARSASQASAGPFSGPSTVGSANSGSGTSDPYAGIKQEVLSLYRSNYKDNSPDLTVEVQSYGCHMGVTVMKAGKAVKSFAYFGRGQIFETNY